MIELGGNIKLEGFGEMEPGKLIVVNKMVGSYARKISDKKQYNELKMSLKMEENNYEINVVCDNEDNKVEGVKSDKNLFFAINGALGDILAKA